MPAPHHPVRHDDPLTLRALHGPAASPAPSTGLPQDAAAVLQLAAQSMFDVFAQAAQGMMVVDRSHRIVWISEGYKRFLPALGFDSEQAFVGRRVEEEIGRASCRERV